MVGVSHYSMSVSLTIEVHLRPWSAGKHLESAGGLARELGNFDEVIDLYKRASELYVQCGKVQPAADALARGARFMNCHSLLVCHF